MRQRSVGCAQDPKELEVEHSRHLDARSAADARASMSIHDLAEVSVFCLRKLKTGREVSRYLIYDYALGEAKRDRLERIRLFQVVADRLR